MQNNFLAFFGHVVMDVTIRVDRLPTIGTVGVNKMEQNFGGTAGNFAMVAAKLGYPFHLFSAVSLKTHSDYIAFLEKIGADTSHLVLDMEDMGPIGYAVTTGEEQIFYFYQGPMGHPIHDRLNIKSLDYRYVHFGTGLPEDYMKFSKMTQNSRIVFDPGQEISYRYNAENLEPLLETAYLTILNNSEYEKAASILGVSGEDFLESYKNLIVTEGKKGSTFYSNGKFKSFPALVVEKPYDTIGAGDAFRAGFYYGLYLGKDIDDSIIMGSITSSQALKKPFRDFSLNGAQIQELYDKHRENLLPK